MLVARDNMRSTTLGRRVLEELPEAFGVSTSPMPPALLDAIQQHIPAHPHKKEQIDRRVLVRLALLKSELSREAFRSRLTGLFPGVPTLTSVKQMRSSDRHAIVFAPVKGEARTLAKVEEYSTEGDCSEWPFVTKVGDLLRASIVCATGDDIYEAWSRVSGGFDVREGRGRLSK